MSSYAIYKIEEHREIRVGIIEASDIYEAAKLAKSITDSDKNANYKIGKIGGDETSDYIVIGRFQNELMYYRYMYWNLLDLGLIEPTKM